MSEYEYMHVSTGISEAREGVGSLKLELQAVIQHGCQELNLGPLDKQYTVFTSALPLQSSLQPAVHLGLIRSLAGAGLVPLWMLRGRKEFWSLSLETL